MRDQFRVWLRLFAEIAKGALETTPCPRCGQPALRYAYVAEPLTRVGYAGLWCESCYHGIRISRTEVPAGISFTTFEEAEDGGEPIPNLHLIEPPDLDL